MTAHQNTITEIADDIYRMCQRLEAWKYSALASAAITPFDKAALYECLKAAEAKLSNVHAQMLDRHPRH